MISIKNPLCKDLQFKDIEIGGYFIWTSDQEIEEGKLNCIYKKIDNDRFISITADGCGGIIGPYEVDNNSFSAQGRRIHLVELLKIDCQIKYC